MENCDNDLECCGNGCNNCVLDTTILRNRINDLSTKINILSNTYVWFRLNSVTQCTANVFQLEFQYVRDQSELFNNENYCLNIPLANYLMLRTKYLVSRQLSSEFNNLQCDAGTGSVNNRKDKHDLETVDDFISRPFTPIDVDTSNLSFKVLIKLLKHGLMSQYIASLKVGDLTEWKGCYGHFEYLPNKYKSIIFITQGVGIAPAYRILENVLHNETDETRIHVLACFKDVENILLRNQLYSLMQYWNFNYTIYLSRPEAGDPKLKYNEAIKMFRLNETETRKIFDLYTNANPKVIVCGGETFSNTVKTILLGLGQNNFVFL